MSKQVKHTSADRHAATSEYDSDTQKKSRQTDKQEKKTNHSKSSSSSVSLLPPKTTHQHTTSEDDSDIEIKSKKGTKRSKSSSSCRSKPVKSGSTDTSEDEHSEIDISKQVSEKNTKRSKPGSSSRSNSKKVKINPINPTPKLTAAELFGNDSDDDNYNESNQQLKAGKAIPPLYSIVTKRLNNGYARQISETKEGAYFVDLKLYNVQEIKNIQPMNRWRHAVTSIKTKIDEDKEAWRHLKAFVLSTCNDFKNSPVNFISTYQ